MNLIDRYFIWRDGLPPCHVGLYPSDQKDFFPFTVWCDAPSYDALLNIYREPYGDEAASHIQDLRSIASQTKVTYWNELLAYLLGPVCVFASRPLNSGLAKLAICAGNSFIYNTTLGLLRAPGFGIDIVRINPMRWSGVLPLMHPINMPIDFERARKQIARNGWVTQALPGKKLDSEDWQRLHLGWLNEATK